MMEGSAYIWGKNCWRWGIVQFGNIERLVREVCRVELVQDRRPCLLRLLWLLRHVHLVELLCHSTDVGLLRLCLSRVCGSWLLIPADAGRILMTVHGYRALLDCSWSLLIASLWVARSFLLRRVSSSIARSSGATLLLTA